MVAYGASTVVEIVGAIVGAYERALRVIRFLGLTMVKQRDDRKPTNVSIHVEFEENQHPAKASIQTTGDLTFYDEDGNEIKPKSLRREMSHDRPKGPKVRTRQTLEHGRGALSGLQQLADYEVIFAIDTNTAEVDGNEVSVAGFMPFSLDARDDGFAVINREKHVQVYEFDTVPDKPELCAIFKLTLDLKKHAGIGRGSHVAIVTDTELGSLEAFNAREAPIYEDHLLPEGFTLLYASSDTGWEVLNKFIRICDKAAEQTIQERRAGDDPEAPFVLVEEIPGIKIRVGRRNAQLSIECPWVADTGLSSGQRVNLYGVKKT